MRLRTVLAGRVPASALLLSAVMAGLVGCTATPAALQTPAATPTPSAPASSSPDASSGSGSGVDSVGADTPGCQPASAAVVAAVNAAMTVPDYGGDGVPYELQALTATPDPDHAVWLLAGVVRDEGYTEGRILVWATTSDPTAEEFTGTLRSIGGQTAQISSAPALQFPDGELAGGLPAAALRCASGGGS